MAGFWPGILAGDWFSAFFLALPLAFGILRARVSPAVMAWVNRLSGLVFAAFGLEALGSWLR